MANETKRYRLLWELNAEGEFIHETNYLADGDFDALSYAVKTMGRDPWRANSTFALLAVDDGEYVPVAEVFDDHVPNGGVLFAA